MAVRSEHEDVDFLAYTREWMDKVNCGGIFPLNDATYQFFICIEKEVRVLLPTYMAKSADSREAFKELVIECITIPKTPHSHTRHLILLHRNLCSAPAAGMFSRILGSIVYENPPMQVPVTDLFDLQLDILTGEQPCCQRQLLTLRKQLISVLNDTEMASSLVTLLLEEPPERLQFIAIVNSFLQRLVSTLQVNAKTYSLDTLSKQDVYLQSGYLGMGPLTQVPIGCQ